jgi:hypothetical protein
MFKDVKIDVELGAKCIYAKASAEFEHNEFVMVYNSSNRPLRRLTSALKKIDYFNPR